MPWWGWIIAAVILLAVLVAGCVYAGIHAVRAVHSIADAGTEIQKYLAAMQEAQLHGASSEVPLFTQPLSTAAHRYSLAQTEVERRRITRHNRHAQRWSVWKRNRVPFTDSADCTVAGAGSQPALQSLGSSYANSASSPDVYAGDVLKAD